MDAPITPVPIQPDVRFSGSHEPERMFGERARHELFHQRRNPVRNGLYDALLIHGDLSALEAQGIPSMARGLDRGVYGHARPLFHVRVLYHRDAAESRDRDR
jgi:hypothetical protein